MELDFGWITMLITIGFVGSFISGMIGIGGSIINYPLLTFIPPLLGFLDFSAQEVSTITAVQVLFSTLAGILAFRKSSLINKSLVLSMGFPIMLGSFLGSYGSRYLPDAAINLTYALLALAAALMMLFSKKGADSAGYNKLQFNKGISSASASIVGLVSGVVGAAGAFITVPIMLVILKIPTRVAIASSLTITFIASIGSSAGKVMGGHLLLVPSAVMVAVSMLGSPIGAKVGQKVNVKVLQWLLAGLITATVIKIWFDILI